MQQQVDFLIPAPRFEAPPGQLLKWIGNKQRFAAQIAEFFPATFNSFYEPFLGSGAVIATVRPPHGFGSDVFLPLVQIFQTLVTDPQLVKDWYAARRNLIDPDYGNKVAVYEQVKAAYNGQANAADLLFLSRTCYGGVVRFRKGDGYMSTPCGIHKPMPAVKFNLRVDAWHARLSHCQFDHMDYRESIARAGQGDMIYCDPPYTHTQAIIYGAQDFRLQDLFVAIAEAKARGARVALSIDGSKQSEAENLLPLPIPPGLFERELLIDNGRCMLRRFQMEGESLENFNVSDRLLLTYDPE